MVWPNGYDRRREWRLLLLTVGLFMALGFFLGRITAPEPLNLAEIWSELNGCQTETRESCSLVVMPDSSYHEVQLLYSQHVK